MEGNMDNRLRLSRYQEHQIEQIQKLAKKEAMTSLVNPAYNSTVGSPTDQVNANTTTGGLSTEERDPLQNEINKMMKESLMDSDFSQTDNKNEGVSIQSAVLGGSSGKSRSKYASTDYSSMGIGNPLENLPGAYSDDDYDDDEDDVYVEEEEDEDRRLTVADDNILRERNKVKAEAMFAGIDFIDDGEDDDESEEEEEEEDDDDEDRAEVVIIEEVDSADEKAPKRVKTDDGCSPKDPDADLMSPDEVIATKLGGILSYYANLEALTKQRSEQIEDDTTSLRGSVSDSSDIEGERHEGLYEMPQQPTPFDSGPSTMDDESTDDCESTYDMLYKSFGLRTQEETFKTDLLSPSQGQHDHGYASETSADERVSPIKRPGMLIRDGFKPPLSALTEDLPLKILSPTTEAESGIEVTPEPKSNKPLLDKELSEAQKNALTKPTTLPPGWREVADAHGTYYWHVPTGTTQWSPPSPTDSQGSASPPKKPAREQKHSHSSSSSSAGGTKDQEQDPNLKEFQKSTLRYANLKLGPSTSKQDQEPKLLSEQNVRGIRFHVRSLGWVEMEDSDLSPGKSSLAVNNCIRQLSYRKNDIRDTAGIWGEGKDMYMVLEDEYLKLTDPNDSTVLNSQHVCSIRVWGVGRDNGRERDFAYVARDKVTKRYKCHVFRCDIPAKAIANALHEICAKVMSERQKGNTISMVTQGQMIRQQQQQQLMQMKSISLDSSKDATHTPSGVDFPTPKMEPITVFRASYVGSTSALRQSGMETLNDAIDKVVGMVGEDQWTPVRIEVAVSTVTVTSVKTKETVAENRIRFMSFLGIGRDSRHFAYIMCIGKSKFQCHVFACEHSAGGLAKAVEAACKLRYQKCLDANPKGSQINSADGKTWGCALKTGIQSIFTKFGTIRIQNKDAPISAV